MNNRQEYIRRLKSVRLDDGEITDITFLQAEKKPVTTEGTPLYDLPSRCNVSLNLKPVSESDIKVAISLPLENWNGRFLGTGNGGAAGSIVTSSLDAGVSRFFATANTDLGTAGGDLFGKKEKIKDFGWRATHLMTVAAKKIIAAFYGREAEHSYFIGGSTGGQQAFSEAQRFPEDYDGIVAFSPAYNRVRLHQQFIWDLKITCENPECKFTVEELTKVKARIAERFAVLSGGAAGDGFLSYPGKIKKPIDVEEVFSGLGLTSAQIETLKKIYTFPEDGKGESIYLTMPLGCEHAVLFTPYIEKMYSDGLCFLHRWAFGNDFDYKQFDFSSDFRKMQELFENDLNATDCNLSAYKEHGGKMILITGSADSLIPYTDGLNYYKKTVEKLGGIDNTVGFFRYFHVPGLGHCSGGTGLQEIGALGGIRSVPLDREHDALEAMIAWVEDGVAPEMLLPVAFKDGDIKKEIDFERPVYPYPYETEYIGGDLKDKNSFAKKLGNGQY